MLSKFLIALCVLSLGISAQAQTKKGKKTVTTTVEETDANGKTTKKTEKVETEADAPAEAPKAAPSYSGDLPTANEDWYTLWGLGFGSSKYSGSVGDAYENAENASGADRSAVGTYDILGFYWPLEGHKTMMGVVYNLTGEVIEIGGTDIKIATALLAFSTHHFFGKNIGDGWFLRGDIGFARIGAEVDFGSVDVDDMTEAGIGLLIGGGYAFDIGEETRMLLGLYYRTFPELEFDNGGDIKGNITNLSIGFLF